MYFLQQITFYLRFFLADFCNLLKPFDKRFLLGICKQFEDCGIHPPFGPNFGFEEI